MLSETGVNNASTTTHGSEVIVPAAVKGLSVLRNCDAPTKENNPLADEGLTCPLSFTQVPVPPSVTVCAAVPMPKAEKPYSLALSGCAGPAEGAVEVAFPVAVVSKTCGESAISPETSQVYIAIVVL